MTATAMLTDLAGRGITLVAAGDDIRISPAGRLTAADRDALRERKAEVLAALHVSRAIDLKDRLGWCDDQDLRRRQWAVSGRIDECYMARNLDGLGTAVSEFLGLFRLMPPELPPV